MLLQLKAATLAGLSRQSERVVIVNHYAGLSRQPKLFAGSGSLYLWLSALRVGPQTIGLSLSSYKMSGSAYPIPAERGSCLFHTVTRG